jgi:mRNA interferase HicA
VNGNEFLRRLKRLARRQGVMIEIDETRGKGSHAKIWLGDRSATLKDRRAEIGKGLLAEMCRQLGIRAQDLE